MYCRSNRKPNHRNGSWKQRDFQFLEKRNVSPRKIRHGYVAPLQPHPPHLSGSPFCSAFLPAVLPIQVSYWAGWAWKLCHVTNDNPTWTRPGSGRLPPSRTVTCNQASSGLRSVARPPPCRGCLWLLPSLPQSTRFGRMGPGGQSTSVYAQDPCHVITAVPWCLIGSNGHGAARGMEDKEADSGNVPSGHYRD